MANEPGKKPVLHTKKHVARLERERQQTRLVVFIFIGIVAAVLILLGYGFLDVKYLQLEKPVAKVGEAEISARDFEAQVRLQRRQLLNSYSINQQYAQLFGIDVSSQLQQIEYYLSEKEILGQMVLDQMIDNELIRQEAVKLGITVSPEELDKYIKEQHRYFPDGTPTPSITPTQIGTVEVPVESYTIVTRTPTPGASTATPIATATISLSLELTVTPAPSQTPSAAAGPTATAFPTATPYTLEGFQSVYADTVNEYSKSGISEDDFRKLMETQILREKLIQAIVIDVPSSEEQVWARHILVPDLALATTIIDRLNAGEDFAALAKELSEDTGSAPNGGDLGWFGKGAMVPEFEAAAFALENPGDITPTAVQSQFGYHIIQLIAHQNRPLTASQIEENRKTAFDDWLSTIRAEYTIDTYDDFWKGHVPTVPDFTTLATEATSAAKTQNAEAAAQTATPQ